MFIITRTSIAHSIREQVQIFQKSLFLVGHPSDGSVLQDDDLRMSLLPSLSTGARSMDQVGAFTPLLNYLSESEIELLPRLTNDILCAWARMYLPAGAL